MGPHAAPDEGLFGRADRRAETTVAQGRAPRLAPRGLALRNAWIISRGGTPIAEASMAKVAATELRTRIANTAMDLLGRYGALSKQSGALAPAEGRMEWAFRIAPIFRFGGGTNEVMRDIIAAAGLGMPR